RAPQTAAPRLHGAVVFRGTRGAAADPQRQSGPARPAALTSHARTRPRDHRRADRSHRAEDCAHLYGAARGTPGPPRGQFLPRRRALAFGDPPGVAATARAGPRAAAAEHLRASQRGGVGDPGQPSQIRSPGQSLHVGSTLRTPSAETASAPAAATDLLLAGAA